MTSTIRPATTNDIDGIARVARAAFGEAIEREVCRAQITDDDIDLHVACEDEAVVGFVSAFAVAGVKGDPWFVDSLAVHPASHNRGHGRRLVESTFATARRLGFNRSRALIRADNTPSQRCFAHCGYASDRRPHTLYIWEVRPDGEDRPTAPHAPVRLLPVDTITYRGVWYENLTDADAANQRHAVTAAHALCAREYRDLSGTLVADPSRLAEAVLAEAIIQGEYHYWERRL